MSAGNRGKWSEAEVKKRLTVYGGYSTFTHFRLPDARAGSFQPTLADFMTMHKGSHGLLEVKEVDHDCRLKHANFDELKVGRCRAWAMAGSEVNVVVCFRPGAKTAFWRHAPIDYFLNRTGGSWDMTDLPIVTLDQALENIYGPPPTRRT